MRFLLAAILIALLTLLVAATSAQQRVNVVNIGYDPCADPNRVTVLGLDQADAADSFELVPVSGVTRIYLCSASLQGGVATHLYVHFGSGAACASTQAFVSYVSTAGLTPKRLHTGGGSATFARSETSRALCIYRLVSTTVKGHVRYVQE